jgi:hypothetical protein
MEKTCSWRGGVINLYTLESAKVNIMGWVGIFKMSPRVIGYARDGLGFVGIRKGFRYGLLRI